MRANNYTKHLAKALHHLDLAGTYATGTAKALPLMPLRVRLSRIFSQSGFEFSDSPPGVRKRREDPGSSELTDAQLAQVGARLAEVFNLKRDPEHADRWRTGWGTKTNLGLALTFLEIADRIQCGEASP